MPDPTPTLRQKLEFFGLSAAVWVICRLPYAALRPLANVLGTIVWFVDRRGRDVALANLAAAFGDALPPARRSAIARASYQRFARTVFELCWSPRLTRDFAERMVEHVGVEHPCHSDPSQPVIYVCLHYGNFEWLSQITGYVIGSCPVVTQRFRNPLLGKIFNRLRSSTGHTILPQERVMIRMLKHLKAGGKFHMVVDLNLDPSEASVVIEAFGGLKTCVTQMHAALAARTGALLVPAEIQALPRGRYRMILHDPITVPPDADPAVIAQRCWDVLEPLVREHPEPWLWPYKHWRFRPSGEPGRYPFYANTAKRFDKMLARAERAKAGRSQDT